MPGKNSNPGSLTIALHLTLLQKSLSDNSHRTNVLCKVYLVPEPTATTVASIPFFWPFSGIRIPPLDFVSAAIRYKILDS